jgi:hypothetical protein
MNNCWAVLATRGLPESLTDTRAIGAEQPNRADTPRVLWDQVPFGAGLIRNVGPTNTRTRLRL